jgi:hypothetical protein
MFFTPVCMFSRQLLRLAAAQEGDGGGGGDLSFEELARRQSVQSSAVSPNGSHGITQMVIQDMSDDDDDDDEDNQANRQDGDFERPITFEQRMARLRQIALVRCSEA